MVLEKLLSLKTPSLKALTFRSLKFTPLLLLLSGFAIEYCILNHSLPLIIRFQ